MKEATRTAKRLPSRGLPWPWIPSTTHREAECVRCHQPLPMGAFAGLRFHELGVQYAHMTCLNPQAR